jgi:phospholipase C
MEDGSVKPTVLTLALALSLALVVPARAQIQSPNPIKHVVIIVQENRTPDNLFGSNSPSNPYYLPGADLATSGMAYSGSGIHKKVFPVPLISIPLASIYNLGDNKPADDYNPDHSHPSWLKMCDLGTSGSCAMDGANHIPVYCDGNLPPGSNCPPAYPQYAYVQYVDVAPYFQIAAQYGYANRMFQTNQGPSFPAHQILFGGTSQPGNGPEPTWFSAENTLLNGRLPNGAPNGCIGATAQQKPPLGLTVQLIDPNPPHSESQTMFPCFNHTTLAEVLDGAKITWTYYTPGQGSLWSAPDALEAVCVPNSAGTKCIGPDWTKHPRANGFVDVAPSDVLKDIPNCNLASVSWVIPSAPASDHASVTDGSGPAWVASIVNAIGNNTTCDVTNGQSGYWYDTAILITWDDWGGWYDHVPPPPLPATAPPEAASYEYGFRVPLMVVSAYTPAGTMDNTVHDFGSVLRFVEDVFGGLGTIPPGTYADSYANDDLSGFFQFNQPKARAFRTIQAPFSADYFINDKRPPEGPDED